VLFEKADMEQLPFDDERVDVVIPNGMINLVPDKPAVFAEIYHRGSWLPRSRVVRHLFWVDLSNTFSI